MRRTNFERICELFGPEAARRLLRPFTPRPTGHLNRTDRGPRNRIPWAPRRGPRRPGRLPPSKAAHLFAA